MDDASSMPAALTTADRDLGGLLLYYADKKEWREGRQAEVVTRILRRARACYWGLGTVYAVMVTEAVKSVLFPERSGTGGRLAALLMALAMTAIAAFVFRRGRKRTRAVETVLRELGSPVPSQLRFVLTAAVAYALLVIS